MAARDRRAIQQCAHGLSDSVELTFEHDYKDYVRGVRVVHHGYWCYEHGRHGTWRHEETIRKANLKTEAEP